MFNLKRLLVSMAVLIGLLLTACSGGEGETGSVGAGAGAGGGASGDGASGGGGSGGGGSEGGGSGSAPETKVLAVGGVPWKTDGTAAGTVRVQNTPFAYTASGITEFNGAFYFQAYDDGVTGFELWKTDGTDAGTVLVKDINPSTALGSFHYRFSDFTVFNGALYFQANDGVNGFELWKTDGTTEGTAMLKDINTAAGAGSSPTDFTVFNGELYFSAGDDVSSRKLWKTDGTAAGTMLVKDINTGTGTGFGPDEFPRGFPVFNGALYFRVQNGFAYELWKTDGTAAGTVLVGDGNTAVWGSHLTYGFAVLDGELYFQANYFLQANAELWKTDGTAAGTVLVKDINTENGGRSSNYIFTDFTVFNGALYFQTRDNGNGRRLWKTDGTAAGTVLVKDNEVGATGSNNSGFAVSNGALYFQSGSALWKTDGTAAGTVLVKDTNPEPA